MTMQMQGVPERDVPVAPTFEAKRLEGLGFGLSHYVHVEKPVASGI